MPCGCKHKKGSGGTYLSGVTWSGYPKTKTGKGMRMSGTGAFRKKRRKKKGSGTWADIKRGMDNSWARAPHGGGFRKKRRRKRASGMGFSGGGINFSGGGMINDAMRVVMNRFSGGKRVI